MARASDAIWTSGSSFCFVVLGSFRLSHKALKQICRQFAHKIGIKSKVLKRHFEVAIVCD